jgi:hypothetical protein
MAERETKPEEAGKAATKTGRGLADKLVIVGAIGAVLVVECVLASLFIPSAADVAAALESKPLPDAKSPLTDDPIPLPEKETAPVIEVELGTYSITSHQPTANTTLRIDFQLVGTVLSSDQTDFSQLFTNHKHRLRDQIIVEVRNSEITDLTDPGLGLIKRRILEKSNALLGKPILRSVVFSEFSFVEQ